MNYPLLEVCADNLVQTCPEHAIHGTAPAKGIISFSCVCSQYCLCINKTVHQSKKLQRNFQINTYLTIWFILILMHESELPKDDVVGVDNCKLDKARQISIKKQTFIRLFITRKSD